MKRLWFLSAATIALISAAVAQTHYDVSGTKVDGVAPIYSYVSAGAGQFGSAITTGTHLSLPAGATLAVIAITGGSVLYRDDGVDPTTTVGMAVNTASPWAYSGPLSALTFTAVTGSPVMNVLYYKAK